MVLSALEPKAFFKHFEAISQIPRGSGNEKTVSDYVTAFARGLGYEVVQDGLMNVIIYKPASAGYEDKPSIILQGHLDMVCEKNAGTEHDFMKDPLQLYINGDFVKAKGTTLGADNGTAVAICMALLEDKSLPHPALEMILTVEEEVGMAGAEGLDASLLTATRMINLDSSEENIITIGCAAGVTVEYNLPLTRQIIDGEGSSKQPLNETNEGTEGMPPLQSPSAFTLTVKGLHGGHSGADINKGRGNANVILGCVLTALEKDCGIRLAEIKGGMKLNAIPREAAADFVVSAGHAGKIAACVEEYARSFGGMYKDADPGLAITCVPTDPPECVFSQDCSDKVITSLLLLPNGVQVMSDEIPNLVAASCNVGVVETAENHVRISCFPRGASKEYLAGMERQIRELAARTGAETRFIERSPAWAYNPESRLLKTVVETYERLNNTEPVVTALHAGLECGILAEKLPGLDIVSLGPDTFDLHTPDERLSISSAQRVWKFILALLEAL
ncbi:MAG: aminoacyl-histidine dipeptidase [Defluviitaleaceae bacterium]|nr:aminoacyl-histidine dipeptidase [Defluviitaleaceae bacterium]